MALAAKLKPKMSHNWFRASVLWRQLDGFDTERKKSDIWRRRHTPKSSLCWCVPVRACVRVRAGVSLALSATWAHHCLVLSRYPWWVGGPGLWDRQAFCGLSDRLCQMTRRLRCHHGPPWRLPSQGSIRASHRQADKWEEAEWLTDGFNLSAQKTKLDMFLPEMILRRRNQWSGEYFFIYFLVHLKAQRGFCLS